MLQIKKSFKPFRFGGRDYDYDEWDQYARIDGWVCRNDRDCSWLDPRLGCNDYEFSINLINVCIKNLTSKIIIPPFWKSKTFKHSKDMIISGPMAMESRIEGNVCLRRWIPVQSGIGNMWRKLWILFRCRAIGGMGYCRYHYSYLARIMLLLRLYFMRL